MKDLMNGLNPACTVPNKNYMAPQSTVVMTPKPKVPTSKAVIGTMQVSGVQALDPQRTPNSFYMHKQGKKR